MDAIAKDDFKRYGIVRTARAQRQREAVPVTITTPSRTDFSIRGILLAALKAVPKAAGQS